MAHLSKPPEYGSSERQCQGEPGIEKVRNRKASPSLPLPLRQGGFVKPSIPVALAVEDCSSRTTVETPRALQR